MTSWPGVALSCSGCATIKVATTCEVETALVRLARAPIQRHLPVNLMRGARQRRANTRLADAVYVELSDQLGVARLTTDTRLARAYRRAEPVGLVGVEGQASAPG